MIENEYQKKTEKIEIKKSKQNYEGIEIDMCEISKLPNIHTYCKQNHNIKHVCIHICIWKFSIEKKKQNKWNDAE